jgi:hypothetical protein
MEIFIFGQLGVVLSDVERNIFHLIKLLPMGPVTPLDAAVELRMVGRVRVVRSFGSYRFFHR